MGTHVEAEEVQLVHAALAGGRAPMRRLVARLSPVVRRAARARLSHWPCDIEGQGPEDLVQIVLMGLLDPRAPALAGWRPRRGRLDTFVRRFSLSRIIDLERRAARRAELERLHRAQMHPATPSLEERAVFADLTRRAYQLLAAQCPAPHAQESLARLFEAPGLPPPSDPIFRQRDARLRQRLRRRAQAYLRPHVNPAPAIRADA